MHVKFWPKTVGKHTLASKILKLGPFEMTQALVFLSSNWIVVKAEKILKGSLNSLKIQIMGGEVCLKC